MYGFHRAILASLLVTACTPSANERAPAGGEANATTSATAATPSTLAPAPAAAFSGELALDPAGSSITFVGTNVLSSQRGSFEAFRGNVRFTSGDLSGIDLEIDMNSTQTENPKLRAHLVHEDFFFVEKFPAASFKTTKVERSGDGSGERYRVDGTLTLRGVSRPVSLPVVVSRAPDQWRGEGTLSLPRKDFGVSYPGAPDNLIRDDVPVTIKLAVAAPATAAKPAPQ